MMTSNRWNLRTALLAWAALAVVYPVYAATLNVGDPAPKLQVSGWVQGEPVKEFARDKTYLVEFWATWCGPCRTSIPHLNQLHSQFKDRGLVVIGQDVLEQDPEGVAAFVKMMGPKMTYRVSLDTQDAVMEQTWMVAAGQEGIPTAFLVDKTGTIAWIGHPLQLQEEVLVQVLDGRYDLAKAVARHKTQQAIEAQTGALWKEFNRLRQNEEWDQAQAALAEIEKLLPEEARDRLDMTRFDLLLSLKKYPEAYQLASRMSDAQPKEAMLQNQLAWTIATKEGLAERNLDLAEKMARRADNATQGQNAEVLDTLARVLFLKSAKEQAIHFQTKAVALAEGGRKKQFQRNLDDYQAGRLPSEATIGRLRRELDRHLRNKRWTQAETALAQLETILPEEDRDSLGRARFDLLVGLKNYPQAYDLAGQLSRNHRDPPMLRNDLAWTIAIQDGADKGALELAEKIARDANEATQGANAEILDTWARLLFLQGSKEQAVEAQRNAVQHASGHRKTQFQATLDSYLQGQIPKPY